MRILSLLLALAAASALGCGGTTGKVKGRVVEDGKPVAIDGQAALMFYLLDAGGKPDHAKSYPMTLSKDGSFELAASGGEMPPGTYLVTMEINAPKSAKGLGKYKGRFGLPDSPLRQEVKAGKNELTVELKAAR